MGDPADRPPQRKMDEWRLITVSVVVVALVLAFLRRPDAFYRPQFWAEDFIFLLDAEAHGLRAFIEPRAGYLHLIPRTIAWVATHFDPLLQPPIFLLGWLTTFVAVLSTSVSPRLNLPVKPLLAAAIVLAPHTGEVFFNPTNAQWIAGLGLLLTALKRDPERKPEWAIDILFVVFAGFSGPFSILLLPVFAGRVWFRRSRASVILLTLAIIPAAVQGWFVVHADPDHEFIGPFRLLRLIGAVSYRLCDNAFFGNLINERTGILAMIAAAAIALALIGWAAWRGPYRRVVGAFALFVVVLVTASAFRKRIDLWGYSDLGDRYFFIPKVVLLWTALIAVVGDPSRWRKWTLVALLIFGVIANGPRFRFDPYRDDGWYTLCPSIRAGQTVKVTINPNWQFQYRRNDPAACQRLP